MNRIDGPLNDLRHLSLFTLLSTHADNDLISHPEARHRTIRFPPLNELHDLIVQDGFPNCGHSGVIGTGRKLATFRHHDFSSAALTSIESKFQVRFAILWHRTPLLSVR